MDIISHGLWGAAGFGRRSKRDFSIAFFFGVFPDLFSFGIFTIANVLGFSNRPNWKEGTPPMESIPDYVHQLYNFTHSLVAFLVVFALMWILRKKPYWLMGGWGLHIVFDIFGHSYEFFPTPIFWPISNWKFNGIPWSDPRVFIPNIVLLVVVYSFIVARRRWGVYVKSTRDDCGCFFIFIRIKYFVIFRVAI